MNMRAINAVRLRADNIRPYGDSAVNNNLTFRPLCFRHQKNRPAPLGGYERLYQLSKAVYSVLNRLMEAL